MLEHGRQIGNFIIDQRIARGSMGEIYRAYQGSMRREIALKIVPVDERVPDRKDAYQRFAREAEVVARLEHTHIVPLHDYGVWQDEFAYLAMRYMRGGALSDLLKREGALAPARAIRLCGQVALALDHAHSRGVIHRDIKPGNILLDEEGNAYLTDFGLAKLTELSLGWTETGTLVGTPLYASPEQIRDSDLLNHRSDLYSFGVVVYHILVGRPPFEIDERGVMGLIRRQLNEAPPLPSSLNPALNARADAILLKALEKDPLQRYPTAIDMIRELADALEVPMPNTYALLANAPAVVSPNGGQSPRGGRSRRTLFVAAEVVVALLLIGAGVLFVLSQRRSDLPRYTLLTNVIGSVEDTTPSDEDAARARERLGERGFVAFIACTLETEMSTFLARRMGEIAEVYELDYRVFNSALNADFQLVQVEDAREQGAIALIVCQLNSQALVPVLETAANEGMILAFNSPPLIGDGAIIMLDNAELGREIGREAGEYIRDQLGGSARVVLLGLPNSASGQTIAQGMQTALLQVAPNAEITGHYDGITPENGRNVTEALLTAGEQIDVVLTVNDGAAFGVIEALEARDIPPESVSIFSINGESLARQYVRQNYYLRATLGLDREGLAQATIQSVIKMLGGGTLPRTILVASSEMITAESSAP